MAAPAEFSAERWLQRLPLFSEIDAESLSRLVAATRLKPLARGELALRAGDPCEAFFVNLGQPIKLYVLAANGNEKVGVLHREVGRAQRHHAGAAHIQRVIVGQQVQRVPGGDHRDT